MSGEDITIQIDADEGLVPAYGSKRTRRRSAAAAVIIGAALLLTCLLGAVTTDAGMGGESTLVDGTSWGRLFFALLRW